MKRFSKLLFVVFLSSCMGQDRVVQEDSERGIVLRYRNVEQILMFGGPGGDAGGSYSLEFSKPSKSYGVKPPCSGEPSFDASFEPIRLTCADKTYAVYLLRDDINAVLGPAGDFRPLKDAAATLIDHHHKRLAEPILNEAYHRGERVEVLITLGDTDIGDYWKMSYDVLTDEEKKRVRDGLRRREGQSKLRDQRLK